MSARKRRERLESGAAPGRRLSSIRLGTPALTTLGFGADEMDEIAGIIAAALRVTTPATTTAKAKYILADQVRGGVPRTLRPAAARRRRRHHRTRRSG